MEQGVSSYGAIRIVGYTYDKANVLNAPAVAQLPDIWAAEAAAVPPEKQ